MITAVFLLTWAAFSSLMSVYVLSSWWIALWVFLGLILAYIVVVLIFFLGHIPILKKVSMTNRYKGYVTQSIAFFTSRFVFNVHVKVIGKKNVPKKGPAVIYANHKSFADPFVIMETIGRAAGYTPKESLYKSWLLKHWFEIMGCMKIHRSDERKTLETLIVAIKQLKEQYAMVVFPEGGIKDRNTEEILQTRAGAFKIAMKSQATIVPTSIVGTLGTNKRMPFIPTFVKVIYHEPITFDEYKDLNSIQIAEKVMNIVNDGLLKYKK